MPTVRESTPVRGNVNSGVPNSVWNDMPSSVPTWGHGKIMMFNINAYTFYFY
jgi:hypothetical protein